MRWVDENLSRRHRGDGRDPREGPGEDRRRPGRLGGRPHGRSAKEFAEKWNIPFTSTNLEACIDRPGVDAVILTTPSDQHHDQTLLALRKGKHVQVEIPMALNLADSQHMLEAAKKAGKVLHGDAHAPLLEPASRDPPAHPGRHVPPAPHGRRDLLLPPHQPEHARPAAVVGRQPALAPRLPLGGSGALDPRRAELGRAGARRGRTTRSSASRWTSPWR